ncbi:unnamed protein product [Protopolystoma xenopodis]|uniref:Uncharacterized protein n=1 Tax=Protopolystoma xenopodis TaxID=117903 RepID=A0A3S5BQI1_9PLAT|nr:unnamed protein product [Protopolystoma xenopodis]
MGVSSTQFVCPKLAPASRRSAGEGASSLHPFLLIVPSTESVCLIISIGSRLCRAVWMRNAIHHHPMVVQTWRSVGQLVGRSAWLHSSTPQMNQSQPKSVTFYTALNQVTPVGDNSQPRGVASTLGC